MATLVFCCTIPATFGFSTRIFQDLKKEGHKIILISSDEENLKHRAKELEVDYLMIPFYRGINPLKDIKAILLLKKKLKEIKPDIIIGATPKAAMVAMIAGKLAGIKKRIYHIYGLPFETAKGIKQRILLAIDKITGKFATNIIPIGTSVRETTLNRKLYNPNKVIQKGLLTVGGVDTDRFNPEKLKNQGKSIRESLDIEDDDIVIGYVARFTYDKGFCDLIDLWDQLQNNPKLHLLIAGSMDDRVPLPEEIVNKFINHERVHNVGYRKDVEVIFSAMDIFLFPSYREGFGNVSIEASAMEIPVVTYDVTGCKDAVEDGVTGFTVPFKKYDDVIKKLHDLIENPSLRKQLGVDGRKRVENNFTRDRVSQNFKSIIQSKI